MQIYRDGAEPLAPPELRARFRLALGSRENSGLVEHHIHMRLVPQGRKDLAGDAKRGPAVVILLGGPGVKARAPEPARRRPLAPLRRLGSIRAKAPGVPLQITGGI